MAKEKIDRRVFENETGVQGQYKNWFLEYASYVILERAVPAIEDGLKPVQRRILHAMKEMDDGRFNKVANIIGQSMQYHPHGDASVYDAMVRMAQPWSMRYMLVNGQGNFGSMDGDPPAAYRYTEAKMERLADEILADIDKETVDFRENYDGTMQEPVVVPAKFPNLLVNGAGGIAVGMATSIPPHNAHEICDAALYLIKNPGAPVEELLADPANPQKGGIEGPDFPTGGIIVVSQTLVFLLAFVFAPKHGMLAARARGRETAR